MQQMTTQQKAGVCEIIEKIHAVIEHDDMHLVLQALGFLMLGGIETEYKMPRRMAVDFCADCIKKYGQFTMS